MSDYKNRAASLWREFVSAVEGCLTAEGFDVENVKNGTEDRVTLLTSNGGLPSMFDIGRTVIFDYEPDELARKMAEQNRREA